MNRLALFSLLFPAGFLPPLIGQSLIDVTAFDPANADNGSIRIFGSGFEGLETVEMRRDFDTETFILSFNSITDKLIEVFFPPEAPYSEESYFLLKNEASVALASSFEWQRVRTNVSSGAGKNFVYVESGGFYSTSGGGNTIFVESGGAAASTGGGENLVLISADGTFAGFNGGSGNDLFFEEGATLTLDGTGGLNQSVEVADVGFSEIVAIPESGTLLIPVAIGLWILLLRRKH